MFIDWLTMYQDHNTTLPVIGDQQHLVVDVETGDVIAERQPTVQHEGSYSTSLHIRVSGSRVTVSGNPSRYGRLENVFGLVTIDRCVEVYNRVLESYGLPGFKKGTRLTPCVGEDGKKVRMVSDGAHIVELHVTTNRMVGKGNVDDFIKAISTQPYRNSIPRLHTNGKTCDWLTKRGKGSTLIYPSIYNKGFELALHSLPKMVRKYGEESDEVKYLKHVIEFCNDNGVVRYEQKIKSAYLRRNGLQFWGFENWEIITQAHNEFLKVDEKLKVEAMDFLTITEKLIKEQGLKTVAANTTAMYAINWMHGQTFNLNNSAVQTHRCRLRKIGIDIALPCDLTKFSLVTVAATRKVEVKPLACPVWYRRPEATQLRAVA